MTNNIEFKFNDYRIRSRHWQLSKREEVKRRREEQYENEKFNLLPMFYILPKEY